MAAKVGPSSLSYGIGVQNRYSAFLEDEDNFVSALALTSSAKRTDAKHRGPTVALGVQSASKSSGGNNSLLNKTNRKVVTGKQSDHQQKSSQMSSDQQLQRTNDVKRQRAPPQQQQLEASQTVSEAKHQVNTKQHGDINYDTMTGKRLARAQAHNNHHQNQASYHLNFPNKENGDQASLQQGKFMRNHNQRQGPNRRPNLNEEGRKYNGPQTDESANNTFGNHVGLQSNEEEKQRRQQKRALDLKHKDQEKRETRRQQTALNSEQLENATNNPNDKGFGESNLTSKGYRNRRQFVEGNRALEDSSRNLRGYNGGRGRGRREPDTNSEQQNEGQQAMAGRAARVGDRLPRNRNGFATGSRGGRGPRSDDQGRGVRDPDRQRPIPNFSDKLDFPSLAS